MAVLAPLSNAQTIATPDGYAGYAGTTGGGNASPITVSTAAAFQSAVNNNNPAVIIVNGMLNVGTVSIGSNKTIVGANANSGLYGGTIQVRGTNYIFQNLNLGPAGSDVMEISGGSRVFIHKCSFHDSTDELCSIVRQADFVTVSWCKFYFDNSQSHSFAHLIGNGDTVTADRGKLHVTMHHNWYASGIVGRIPRVRFGHVHLYNNYLNSVTTGYCIGVGVECSIRVENVHFDGVGNCWADYGGSSSGKIGWAGLKFTGGSTQPTFMPNTFPVFTPPYAFTLDPVDNVKALVQAGAGNVFGGTPVNNAPSVSVTSPANGATFTAPAGITINASVSDSDGTIASVAFYQGSTLLGTDTTAPYSFTWNNVAAGTYSLTARATDNAGASTTSAAVSVTVNPASNNPPSVSVTSPANGATFTAPAGITINASVSDSDGTIASVAFYQGSTLLGTDTTAPYSFTWNSVAAGTYSLTARATDNAGASTTSTAVSVTVSSGGGGVPTPLIKLGFNENTGTSVANSGSVSASFTKTTPPAWSTNVPASGGGTSSVDFGTTAGNSYVESSAILSPLAGLTSFTVTGWVNNRSSTQGAGGNRIVSWIRNGGNGVDIVYRSTGALQVGINQWPDSSPAISNAGRIPTNSSAPASNWTFFAVTYNAATSTLQFYFGSNSAAATLDKTVTYNRGAVGTNIGKLAIGHFNAESSRTSRTDRMFRGLIDQVGIHGSVLTLAQIQAVQTGSAP